jgi:hypothetical protein
MALLTSIVDLDSIRVKNPPFQPQSKSTEIEALARTVIELGGLIDIPIVQLSGIEEYDLVSGHLEYFAYLKALELSPTLPDRLTVFIMNNKNETPIRSQLSILGQITTPPVITGNDDLRMNNLELRVSQGFQELSAAIAQLKVDILLAIDAKLPRPIPPLDSFNRISEPEIAHMVQRKMEFLGAKKAQKIVSQLQANKPSKDFKSFRDVLTALSKGSLSQAKLLEVIDRWDE